MPTPTLSIRRKLLYATIAVLVGLVGIALALECALRLVGYGYSPHFAQRVRLPSGETVWHENRWCTAPYFSPALVRRPQPFVLPAKKPPRAYRIFVLGSSAAMGDPDASFSLARVLETLLRPAYPDVRFEIVNAGITAINSHVLRGIAADCARAEPDLFIVYEGNNEVIGPFGPAGVLAPFFARDAFMRAAGWMETMRSGQWIRAIGRSFSGRDGAPSDWGGMQMFLRQQIAADDDRLATVRDRFRSNLAAIAAHARTAGATTLLCTVLTNTRDFAPFMSRHRADLSAPQRAEWNAAWATATAAQRNGDLAAAEKYLRRAVAIDDRYAEASFRLGRLLLQRGNDDEARALLQRALDLDTLRFRTDSRLNEAIREVANTTGATLVDLAAELSANSAHGVLGDDLLYEHVHLTFRGTYEAAVRLLPAITTELQRRGLATGAPMKWLTIDETRQRLGFTTYEQAMIGLELLKRFRAAPFSGQADNTTRIAAWERRVATANELLNRADATDALFAVYRAAIEQAPNDWILARNAGAMLVARGKPVDALPLLTRAHETIPDDVDTLIPLALAHRALGHAAEAGRFFAQARALEPRHPLLPKE